MKIEKICIDCKNILVKIPYEYVLMLKNCENQLPVEAWVCSKCKCREIRLYFQEVKDAKE